MTSIKVKFRPSTIANNEGTIFYQIVHDRIVRRMHTSYQLYETEWDGKHSHVIPGASEERKILVNLIHEHIIHDMERLTKIVRKFETTRINYSSDDIIDEFKRYSDRYSLLNFMDRIIMKLKQNGKYRTAEAYTSALHSFKKFIGHQSANGYCLPGNDIMLDCINSQLMEDYTAWQQQRGISSNTISFYNRILRAVYRRAVEDDITPDRHPFRHVYTGIDKTLKRALPLSAIRKINALDLSHSPDLKFARDIFILSFMLRGMSFIDMAYLKKSDLSDGFLTYRRKKTGQQLTIEWTEEMQRILDSYPKNRSIYLLPIIKRDGTDERYTSRNTGYKINRNLKSIGRSIGLNMPLTLYVARHSWATAAKSKGIPLNIISEAMGHDSETTTRIYLANLDTSEVDKANSLILQSL